MEDNITSKFNKNHLENVRTSTLYKYIIKCLITIIITLFLLILLKKDNNFKSNFYKEVYEKNFSFAVLNNYYEKLFGFPIPFIDNLDNSINPVFSEKLVYKEKEEYLDGVKFTVSDNYLVPVIESGMVVFIGDKENFKNTVIVSQVDGIDAWYTNVTNINVDMYDYVSKGSFLGNTINDELILTFKKDGNKVDYIKYVQN